ncbi:MAG: maleylacetoacetate isomerase [Rhodospirillaceae bacterium]|jgi:maleylacetoacetate isomerase|nr:maleylacetoacetate isomerase [Rhodospirillaceae bacterium]MBT6202689.1 maleylacetoacetate isomerase [Rhodospirillaceae bacterium]MBT6511733.1 maleylacetoacetate isomerase [Rhodospirillaceae bacterium]MBT7615137.1 maleylacetoacetate isomerase [Rhodospirillaceae bacterium]
MRLYTRYRNSAGERVRIALNLKGLDYDYVAVSSLPRGAYRAINPQGLMPTLEVDGQHVAQSGAILEYLEERFPEPSLLPADPIDRARARSFGAHIAAEMHALTVTRVRSYLTDTVKAGEDGLQDWLYHWLGLGLRALESSLEERSVATAFCFSEMPGWADLHLVPQLSICRGFGVDLGHYPLLVAIDARCQAHEAFQRAEQSVQPDFPG